MIDYHAALILACCAGGLIGVFGLLALGALAGNMLSSRISRLEEERKP